MNQKSNKNVSENIFIKKFVINYFFYIIKYKNIFLLFCDSFIFFVIRLPTRLK